jgi:hypothetical protein
MTEPKYDLEGLRPAEYVWEADPRNTMLVRVDLTNGTSRPIELADHHEQISAYLLHAGVPQEIVLQFETARNVYLYAWFVYRFYPVAEHQCLAARGASLDSRAKTFKEYTGFVRRIGAWRWARAGSGRSKRGCGSRTRSWHRRRGILFISV